MKTSRGLAALILTILFQTQLAAEYLYKDTVIFNPKFQKEVQKLGSELYEKTGISLRLMMLKELPEGINIAEYEKEAIAGLKEPTIVLTFSEMDSKVDILANDKSLYKYFDKKQVLSPAASLVQAYLMAVLYSSSFDDFNEVRGDYGGTILPLLAEKTKKNEHLGKFSGAMFNGYIDIAGQIAKSKGVELEYPTGSSNNYIITTLKVLFYGTLLYALIMYLKKKFYLKRQADEY